MIMFQVHVSVMFEEVEFLRSASQWYIQGEACYQNTVRKCEVSGWCAQATRGAKSLHVYPRIRRRCLISSPLCV